MLVDLCDKRVLQRGILNKITYKQYVKKKKNPALEGTKIERCQVGAKCSENWPPVQNL